MSADQQGGALKPISLARVADELRKLSSQRKDGELDADEYEHRFSRMITELRDRRIDGTPRRDPRHPHAAFERRRRVSRRTGGDSPPARARLTFASAPSSLTFRRAMRLRPLGPGAPRSPPWATAACTSPSRSGRPRPTRSGSFTPRSMPASRSSTPPTSIAATSTTSDTTSGSSRRRSRTWQRSPRRDRRGDQGRPRAAGRPLGRTTPGRSICAPPATAPCGPRRGADRPLPAPRTGPEGAVRGERGRAGGATGGGEGALDRPVERVGGPDRAGRQRSFRSSRCRTGSIRSSARRSTTGVVAHCAEQGIGFLAYSPTGGGPAHPQAAGPPGLQPMAARLGVTAHALVLAWAMSSRRR